MLIKDLSKELDTKAMTAVRGGDNGNSASNVIGQAMNHHKYLLSLAAAMLICCVLCPPPVDHWPFGSPNPATFAAHPMFEATWIVWRLVATIVLAFVFLAASRKLLPAVSALIYIGVAVLLVLSAIQAYPATSMPDDNRGLKHISSLARQNLPPNAVLLIDEQFPCDCENIAFRSGFTCYALNQFGHRLRADMAHSPAPIIQHVAARIRSFGGVPFVVSYRQFPYPIVESSPSEHYTIYTAP